MRRILKRQSTPAMAVAFVALFTALSGLAIAGPSIPGKGRVHSTDIHNGQVKRADIRNNAVNSAKVANGSLLAADFRAGQLPAGPRGATGATGATGPAGPITGELPSGVTQRGTFSTSSNQGSTGINQVSFGFRLSAAPTARFIPQGTPPPAECPGSVADPEAQAGNFCVYESTAINVTAFRGICNPASPGCAGNETTRYGAATFAQPASASPAYSFGTWAVTAP